MENQMSNRSKVTVIILVIVFVLSIFLITYGVQLKLSMEKKPFPKTTEQSKPLLTPTPVLPTKTQEEVEVIKKTKDYQIEIINNTFVPTEIIVKANDQVFWINKDEVVHKINGKNWGGAPIWQNEKFAQSFNIKGIYQFFLDNTSTVEGKVIVE